LGRKLFCEAHAWISVPSTVKCSSLLKRLASRFRNEANSLVSYDKSKPCRVPSVQDGFEGMDSVGVPCPGGAYFIGKYFYRELVDELSETSLDRFVAEIGGLSQAEMAHRDTFCSGPSKTPRCQSTPYSWFSPGECPSCAL